jgi:hypothetical protein
MYLRISKQKRADGSEIAHLQFAESIWDPDKKRSQVHILSLANCYSSDYR